MGFWVAITRKGGLRGMVVPSMVTWRSSMASSRAAWVLGGARLISSASRTLVNTGPGTNWKFPSFCRQTLVPKMSAGSRSGVNCTRLVSLPMARVNTLASRVLPNPGKSSKRTWPLARAAASSLRSSRRLPTNTSETRSMIWSHVFPAASMSNWFTPSPAPVLHFLQCWAPPAWSPRAPPPGVPGWRC